MIYFINEYTGVWNKLLLWIWVYDFLHCAISLKKISYQPVGGSTDHLWKLCQFYAACYRFHLEEATGNTSVSVSFLESERETEKQSL